MTLVVVAASSEALAWLTKQVKKKKKSCFLLANLGLLRRLLSALVVWLPFGPFTVARWVALRFFTELVLGNLESTWLDTFVWAAILNSSHPYL